MRVGLLESACWMVGWRIPFTVTLEWIVEIDQRRDKIRATTVDPCLVLKVSNTQEITHEFSPPHFSLHSLYSPDHSIVSFPLTNLQSTSSASRSKRSSTFHLIITASGALSLDFNVLSVIPGSLVKSPSISSESGGS